MKVTADKKLYRAWRVVAVALVVFVAVVVAIAARADAQGAWKGTVADVKGVKTVSNPATGFAPAATVKLPELWRVGGDAESEDEFFGVVSDIDIDAQGNVYLLDSQLSECKIYSKDGEYQRSIGREGEGPGEFRRPVSMFFTADGKIAIVQVMPGKIVLLGKDGQPAGEHPIPPAPDGGFQILQGAQARGGNVVLFMARTKFDQAAMTWSRTGFLTSIDPKGKQLAEYVTKDNTINMAAAVMDDKSWDSFERRWEVGPDGRVYACLSYDSYEITVYNKAGGVERVITREYKHVPRSAKEKDFMNRMMTAMTRQVPNAKVTIADNTKDIENIYVRDDGSVWVLTSAGARNLAAGTMGTFDVFNPQGQFVKTVTLKGQGDPLEDLYVFEKDRVYVVTSFLQAAMSAQGAEGLYADSEEAEPMAVISYQLAGDAVAGK
jgi:hypothetical protein